MTFVLTYTYCYTNIIIIIYKYTYTFARDMYCECIEVLMYMFYLIPIAATRYLRDILYVPFFSLDNEQKSFIFFSWRLLGRKRIKVPTYVFTACIYFFFPSFFLSLRKSKLRCYAMVASRKENDVPDPFGSARPRQFVWKGKGQRHTHVGLGTRTVLS